MPLLRASMGLVSVNWKEQGMQHRDGWGDPADIVSRSQHGDEELFAQPGDEEQVIRQL